MTIKELSQELQVSEQALRSWCKRNGVRKESESETKGKKAGYFLTENDIEQIRNYYSKKGNERKDIAKGKESKSNQTLDILQAQLSEKDKQISELQKQLADAATERKQLTEEREKLTAERQTTLAKLFSLQDKNEKLQLELAEYKSIVDKKQAIIEVDAAPTKEQASADQSETRQHPETGRTSEEDPPQQKLSFFQRLFRKRSK